MKTTNTKVKNIYNAMNVFWSGNKRITVLYQDKNIVTEKRNF